MSNFVDWGGIYSKVIYEELESTVTVKKRYFVVYEGVIIMTTILFKFIAFLAKVAQYLLLLCSAVVVLGIFMFFVLQDQVLELMEWEQLPSYPITILVGFIAVAVLICYAFSFYYFRKIILRLAEKNYFVVENAESSVRIAVLTLMTIILQVGAHLLFDFFNIENASSLFDFSHTNYFYGIIIVVVAFAGFLIFKKGKALKDDADGFI
ncbi:DUF2975 domain-containing protein [Streptococcus sp. FT1-106]|uniref:DUF2975 domain-containing protein n=1 Tax=unclassified Streptococcus TaxID=2608887 RepID=UPI003BF4D81C